MRIGLLLLAITAVAGGVLYATSSWPFGTDARTLRYAAVGDSLTSSGSDSADGWVAIYGASIKDDLRVDVKIVNTGIYGAPSGVIADAVEADSNVRSAIRGASLVTLNAGINDFHFARGAFITGSCGGADNQDCLRTLVEAFDANWDRMVNAVKSLAPSAALRSMNLYYAFVGEDQRNGTFAILDGYLSQMNAHIAGTQGVLMADVHRLYNGADGAEDPAAKGYLLSDNVHSAPSAHRLTAEAFRALGYAGLSAAQGVAGVSHLS